MWRPTSEWPMSEPEQQLPNQSSRLRLGDPGAAAWNPRLSRLREVRLAVWFSDFSTINEHRIPSAA
jgi:hypothetical protein